jgi:hypothetical protein
MPIVKLDFRGGGGIGGIVLAVHRFRDVECLRANALAIHENAEAAGICHLGAAFFLVFDLIGRVKTY